MNNIENILPKRENIENLINKYTTIYDPNCIVKINNINKLSKTMVNKSFCCINNDNYDEDNFCNINFYPNLSSSNERLEFLGDRVLELVVVEYLFDNFKNEDEGFLTKLKIKLVKKETLAMIGKKIGIDKFILLSSTMERIGSRQNNIRILEDTLESFIGGLYKDQNSNIYPCKAFILGIFKKHINIQEYINLVDDFKSMTMNFFHKEQWSHPTYILIKNEGDITGKKFNSSLCVEKDKINNNCIEKYKKIDVKNRSLIKDYNNNDDPVDPKYFVLSTNVIPEDHKKQAEQICCEMFLKSLK